MSNKPLVFNYKDYKELKEAYAELEKENAHLRGTVEGAKVLIYQQKHLVRCRDCIKRDESLDCPFASGFFATHDSDFCSVGERKGETDGE